MPLGDKKKKFLQKKVEVESQGPKILAGRYELDSKIIGRGVSSTVMAAIDLLTGRKVAVKKINRFLQNKHESLRILRQIILLRVLEHPNIIKLRQIILQGAQKNQLYIILEYVPKDIKKMFKSNSVPSLKDVKSIIFQLLAGLKYCHECQVLHRDLKPENILVTDDYSEVKLCDFGLARAVMNQDQKQFEKKQQQLQEKKQIQQIQQQLKQSKQPQKTEARNNHLSLHVTTRWYRAPQLIILQKKYNSAIDIWSVGCILAQLIGMLEQNHKYLDRKVLFPGKACYPLSPPKNNETNYKKINDFPHSVSDQLSVIFDVLGTPEDISFITDERAKNYIKSFGKVQKKPFKKIFNFIPEDAVDFLEKSLTFNPNNRLTINEAIKHPFFNDIRGEFEFNISISGEPVITDIEGLSIQQIKQRVIMEHEYYQSLRKQEMMKADKKQ